MILDSTCSDKKLWPEKADVRMDIKPEVQPDIVADAKHLPFREHVFDEIYCDPPHLIRNDIENWTSHRAKDLIRFGTFKNRSAWLTFLYDTNKEFSRTLRQQGILRFKITDGKDGRVTKLSDLKYLPNFVTVSDANMPSRAIWSHNTTHFLEMKPK